VSGKSASTLKSGNDEGHIGRTCMDSVVYREMSEWLLLNAN